MTAARIARTIFAMVALAAGLEMSAAGRSPIASPADLPGRIRRIVLHTLGGPFYRDPARRWVFYPPRETLALWRRPQFGAHWIVWTDGTVWPRHPRSGEASSWAPPRDGRLDEEWRARLAREAAPVYSHTTGSNSDSVGIEVAHSGRTDDPFPDAQVRSIAWLVRALLEASGGRLTPADVVGHKDLDDRPAYVHEGCQHDGCPFYVDDAGNPLRRRVDPPEGLFAALARHGLVIPRRASAGDREIDRAAAVPADRVPGVRR